MPGKLEKIRSYTLTSPWSESRHFMTCEARDEERGRNVVIRVFKSEQLSPAEKAIIRHNLYPLLGHPIEGIVGIHEIIDYRGSLALVTESFRGISLKAFLHGTRIDIHRFLSIAIQLASTLGLLHALSIAHKYLSPRSILIDQSTGTAKVTDWGVFEFVAKTEKTFSEEFIKDTLTYLSPEMTGRINRTVDYRTDIYSLGVIFYEMLSGTPPFTSNETAGLIHAHLAMKAEALAARERSVPQPLSDIVMKMLSKTAEDRYQNCLSLKADLEECLSQWQAGGAISPFTLSKNDASLDFYIPDKIFGREAETAELLDSFKRVAGGTNELFLIKGDPGVGKSSLIYEIQKHVLGRRGFFISGKYERLKQEIPYSAIAQAFRALMANILSDPEESIRRWIAQTRASLGPNGRLLTDIVPELEMLVGKQPPVPELGAEEAMKRFFLVFQKFVAVFAAHDHPLVLFLDDLQWADSASIGLMRNLLSGGSVRHVLVIGSYRINEVTSSHPLIIAAAELAQAGSRVTTIHLNPLDVTSSCMMVANFLRRNDDQARDLGRLIHEKTGGNPLFIIQLLRSMYEDKTIVLDPSAGWIWDLRGMTVSQSSGSMVDWMASRIRSLPPETAEVLTICSFIGNRWSPEKISGIMEKPPDAVIPALTGAVRENLLYFDGTDYQFFHDHIREAAYSLIPEDEKRSRHRAIGLKLLRGDDPDSQPDSIFEIVDHLNCGIGLPLSNRERDELALLNLRAAKRAMASTAFASALNYALTGIQVLPPDAWDRAYETAFPLALTRIECEYSLGNFKHAEDLSNELVTHARSKNDKASVYDIMIRLYAHMERLDKALQVGLHALKMLGIKLEQNPSRISLLVRSFLIELRWGIQKLKHVREATDPTVLRQAMILLETAGVAYYINPPLYALMLLATMRLTFKHGHNYTTPFTFVAYGSIISALIKREPASYEYGKAAIRLCDRYNHLTTSSKTYYFYAVMLQYRHEHARNCIPMFNKGLEFGINAGEFIFSGRNLNNMIACRIIIGDPIDDIIDECGKYGDFMRSSKEPYLTNFFEDNLHFLYNLKGRTKSRYTLSDDTYDEDARLTALRRENNQTEHFHHLTNRLRIQYLYGRYETSLSHAVEMENIVPLGSFHGFEYYYYYALTLAALYPGATPAKRRRYKKTFMKQFRRIRELSAQSPENYGHKHCLLKAELMRITGRDAVAIEWYHRAIEGAMEHGYTQDQGIANELIARLYACRGAKKIAAMHVHEARQCFARWGAVAKVADIDEKAVDLAGYLAVSAVQTTEQPGLSSLQSTITETIDHRAVINAAFVISSEIYLDRLLKKLVRILIENAGAARGVLILDTDGELYVAAASPGPENGSPGILSMPLRRSNDIPLSIIHYAHRTKNAVILDDACREGIFTRDPVVKAAQVRSVLAIPLTRQESVTGVIYLENNLTAGAFTSDRIELVKLIAVQSSISIENATLYGKTLQAESELEAQYEELEATNEQLTHALDELSGAYNELDIFKRFAESSGQGLAMSDMEENITYMNTAACRIIGEESPGSVVGKSMRAYYPGDIRAKMTEEIMPQVLDQGQWTGDLTIVTGAGELRQTIQNRFLIRSGTGQPAFLATVITDITDRIRLENQLRQAQKMEAVGALAGGIAHDFNNLLTAISGYSELLLGKMEEDDPKRMEVREILKAADRSASLTRQLLAFSRKQLLKTTVLDLNRIVGDMEMMLKRLIGENIELVTELSPDIGNIKADPGQIEQVIMNLAINARDSMPGGGRLTIRTGTHAADAHPRHEGGADSCVAHVRLSIQDTGNGIPEEIIPNIFEPFFSTKDAGQGTGLGLSVVYGIIAQHRGWISVDSKLGAGTLFTIYLPVVQEEVEAVPGKTPRREDRQGRGKRILLVEDQDEVRSFVNTALTRSGYVIFEAATIADALRIFESESGNFDLIFSDVVLPDGSGITLIEKFIALKPVLKVILSSGYTDQKSQWESINERGYPFLQKPYKLDTLLKVIHDILH